MGCEANDATKSNEKPLNSNGNWNWNSNWNSNCKSNTNENRDPFEMSKCD